jgi:alpha-glucosidase
MRAVVEATHAALPPDSWPSWTGSNHDAARLATRWCDDDEALARCALLILLTLRGTPTLYYGDELALANGAVPDERRVDIAPVSRDPGRTPMPWAPNGFWTDPWLPLEDTSRNVESQRTDPESTLHFTRDLIALRRRVPELRLGRYEEIEAPAGAWAWRRGDTLGVAVNLGDAPVEIPALSGTIALATDRAREGEAVAHSLRLDRAQGVVVSLQT